MTGYKEALELLASSIHSMFNKEINFFDSPELNISIVLLDGFVDRVKTHIKQDAVEKSKAITMASPFYINFIRKISNIPYRIEISEIKGEKSFQFIISLENPNLCVVDTKILHKGVYGYKMDFTHNQKLVNVIKIHRLDQENNFL